MLATSTATFKAGPSRKKKPAAGSRTSSRDPPPSGAWKPLAQTPHRRLHQTRRDARARHMRGRPDRTPQARDTARLAISRRSSPNLRSQNSSPALGKSTMSDRLHHHHVAISPPLQPRRKHGTDARLLGLHFAHDHHAFHEDAKPGDLKKEVPGVARTHIRGADPLRAGVGRSNPTGAASCRARFRIHDGGWAA